GAQPRGSAGRGDLPTALSREHAFNFLHQITLSRARRGRNDWYPNRVLQDALRHYYCSRCAFLLLSVYQSTERRHKPPRKLHCCKLPLPESRKENRPLAIL